MRRLTFRDPDISCLAAGPPDGSPVLCLHGFPDVPQTYEGLMHALAEAGFHAVAPWMPGYAPSSPDGPFDPESNARRLLALADRLAPERPLALVGHDWGAVTAYLMLAEAPERFARAVTMAIPHPGAFAENMRRNRRQGRRSAYMGFFQLRGIADLTVRARDFAFVERLWATWSPGFEPPEPLMSQVKQCLAASLPAPLDYYRDMFASLATTAREGGRPSYQRLSVPTLYLHGRRDGCCGPEMIEGHARWFTGGLEEEVLDDAGHFLHLEQPERVQRRIVRFLSDADEG